VKRRLERFAAEINELVEIDASVPAKKRVALGVLLACRPWNISIVHALRADADAPPPTYSAGTAPRLRTVRA
jgi:hypothetical protein